MSAQPALQLVEVADVLEYLARGGWRLVPGLFVLGMAHQ